MTYFAPVCPVHITEQLHIREVLPPYHLLLAHDILSNKKGYEDLYGSKRLHGGPQTVILDNSVIELGSAVSVDIIEEAAIACAANVVVLPDVLQNGPATVEAVHDAVKPWVDKLRNNSNSPLYGCVSFMVVPQGATFEEWVDCVQELNTIAMTHPISWWGIPRNFTGRLASTRKIAIDVINAIATRPPKIHMLGFSEDIIDDVLSTRYGRAFGVRGIDSAVPLRAASLGLEPSMTLKLPPRGNWWETVKYKQEMAYHVDTFNRWVHPRNFTN